MEEGTKVKNKNTKFAGIGLLILACVCFILGYSNVNNEDYSFYKDHYETCMDGYNDTITDPNSYSGYFTSTYDYIASSYEKMAEDDEKKMWEFRIQSIAFCIGGAICAIFGFVIMKM
ncbi:hypothetical protein [Blautia sp. 1033sp1_1033st1_G9_1033SCRN_220408]|uniref:hypothetical protein n=1 Tax=Blautia sp. 1033sp1_1033st1_G9_1033SCRN_220408 TaxID=3144490 RepID=UPI0034A3DDBF